MEKLYPKFSAAGGAIKEHDCSHADVTFHCCLNISWDANLFISQVCLFQWALRVFIFRTQETLTPFSNLSSHRPVGTTLIPRETGRSRTRSWTACWVTRHTATEVRSSLSLGEARTPQVGRFSVI